MECKSLTALITNCLLLLVSFSLKASITISEVIETEEKCDLSNGTITIMVDGDPAGVLYSIDGGDSYQLSNFFDGLESKDYLIIVRKGSVCSDVFTAQIADVTTPEINFDFGCQTGSDLVDIDLIPFNTGIPPFTFKWTGPSGTYNTEDLVGVSTGPYSLSVIDRDGCQVDTSFVIPVCCAFHTSSLIPTEEFSCRTELEDILDFDFENLPQPEIIKELEEKLGIIIDGDPCNDLEISITKLETSATDCEDDLRIEYKIEISDGISSEEFSKVFLLENHIELELISDASHLEFSCDSDIEASLQEYLSTIGGAKVTGCPSKYSITTIPENPELLLDCVDSGSLNIEFVISDNCSNMISTLGNLILVDDNAPEITCPEGLQLDLSDSDVSVDIETWLQEAEADDNCSKVILTNDFSYDEVVQDCFSDKEILFQAMDECGNISTCKSVLSAFNKNGLSLTCPDTIQMGCTEIAPDSLFFQLLQQLELESNLPYELTYDYSIDVYEIDCDFVYSFGADILMTNTCDEEADCKINLEVQPEPKVYIANVFTPNDSHDNRFTVYANPVVVNVEEFRVFDKWGELVFETYDFLPNDESRGWDGEYQKEQSSGGIFAYYAIVRSVTGELFDYSGDVALLK